MSAKLGTRRWMLAAGGAALIAMGSLTAGCGNNNGTTPSTTTTTTTTTTTSSPAPTPTEKNIDPTGGNLFTPGVRATPAPTEPPGVHHH